MEGSRGRAPEPAIWFVVFDETTTRWWLRGRWWPGRFKHVQAFGYVSEYDAWLFYDVGYDRTRVALLPNGPASDYERLLVSRAATVLCIAPRVERRPRWWRVGFWCVPAVSHLVGIGRWCFRPDTLYRAMIEAGATVCGAGPPDLAESASVEDGRADGATERGAEGVAGPATAAGGPGRG